MRTSYLSSSGAMTVRRELSRPLDPRARNDTGLERAYRPDAPQPTPWHNRKPSSPPGLRARAGANLLSLLDVIRITHALKAGPLQTVQRAKERMRTHELRIGLLW